MGHQLLTKLFATLLLVSMAANAAETIRQIEKLVHEIKQKRTGLDAGSIRSAKDPFYHTQTRVTASTPKITLPKKVVFKTHSGKKEVYHFDLKAIINNRIKLNGQWYGLHDTVHGFSIEEIGEDDILLRKKREQIRIFLDKKRNNKIKLNVH